MLGEPPGEVLTMDELEGQLTRALAVELEKWRWEQMGKTMGG